MSEDENFIRQFKSLVQKENRSLTKITTFNKLLRRFPGVENARTFKLSFKLIELARSKKPMHIDGLLFVKDIPWTICFYPRQTLDSHSVYDAMITCLLPNALFRQDSVVTVKLVLDTPDAHFVFESVVFKAQESVKVADLITTDGTSLGNDDTAVDIEIGIEILSDASVMRLDRSLDCNVMKNKNYITFDGEDVLEYHAFIQKHLLHKKLPMVTLTVHPVTELIWNLFSAFLNLISEETMLQSTSEHWINMVDFVCGGFIRYRTDQSGALISATNSLIQSSKFLDHVIMLFNADFPGGKSAPKVLLAFYWTLVFSWRRLAMVDESSRYHTIQLLEYSFALLSIIGEKVQDKKCGIRVFTTLTLGISSLVTLQVKNYHFSVQKEIAESEIYGKTINKILEFLSPVFIPYNLFHFANFLDPSVVDPILPMFTSFIGLSQEVIINEDSSKILRKIEPKIAKTLLLSVLETMISPYQPSFYQLKKLFRFGLIAKEARKEFKRGGKYFQFLKQWLQINDDVQPLFFDFTTKDFEVQGELTLFLNVYIEEVRDVFDKATNYSLCRRFVDTMASLMEEFNDVDFIDVPLTDIIKLKEEGNQRYKRKLYLDAFQLYTKALVNMKYKVINNTPSTRLPSTESYYEEVIANHLLVANIYQNRASVLIELDEYCEAIANINMGLSVMSVASFHNTTYVMQPGYSKELESRMMKLKLKRAQALLKLNLGGHALTNVLGVLEHGKFRDFALPSHYYPSLVSFLYHQKTPQYPPFCVICCELGKTLKICNQLTIRCSECRHPYCSVTCQEKDSELHIKFCAKLSKFYQMASESFKERQIKLQSLLHY